MLRRTGGGSDGSGELPMFSRGSEHEGMLFGLGGMGRSLKEGEWSSVVGPEEKFGGAGPREEIGSLEELGCKDLFGGVACGE